MKTKKKLSKSTSQRKTKLSPIKMFFMKALRTWCDEPELRQDRTDRKKEISKILQKDIQTLKNMYLYGQGSMDDWFKAMDYISDIQQESVIRLYESYPLLENKLQDLGFEQLKMLRYMKQMSEPELELINKLIETGLKLNGLSKNNAR